MITRLLSMALASLTLFSVHRTGEIDTTSQSRWARALVDASDA